MAPVAVLREHCHRLGLKSHEAADGSGSLLLGAGLQQASYEDEGNDDTGRLEVQMRLDAAGEPELGEKQIERTEQPRHSGTAGHEGIHIDGPVPQLPDRVDEEAAAEDEDHHRGQYESHPLPPAQVHEEHTEDKDGQGSYDSTCGLTPESAVLPETLRAVLPETLRLRCLLLILHVRYQTVTGLLDGLSQSLGRALAVIVAHQGCGRGIVHIGLLHPFAGVQDLVYPGRACRTAQARNRKYLFFLHIPKYKKTVPTTETACFRVEDGTVEDGTRTHDPWCHKPML